MTEAHKRANIKYNRSMDNIMIRPSKDIGAMIRAAAAAAGQPVQRYVIQAALERIDRDCKSSSEPAATD